VATGESQQFPFFLQAAIELSEKLEALGSAEALLLAKVMRGYEQTFRGWMTGERPGDSAQVISDFLTASRSVMTYLMRHH